MKQAAFSFESQIKGAVIRPNYIKVPSASKPGESHFVSRGRAGHLTCDCIDYRLHGGPNSPCRHILAALIASGRACLAIEDTGDALRLALEAALADPIQLVGGYLFADYRSFSPAANSCRYGYSPRNYNPPATISLRHTRLSQLELEALPVALRATLIELDGGDVLATLRPRRQSRRAA